MTLIDAHIHIHECFDLKNFFNSAKKNFLESYNDNKSNNQIGVLCLTESYGSDYFRILSNNAENIGFIDSWKITKTENDNVLIIEDESEFKIVIVAGRQIVSSERLEVLAIGMTKTPRDGGNIKDLIEFVSKNNSIPILPWGVGKWSGSRGGIIEAIVKDDLSYKVYLGDNGNRPWFLSKSKIFEIAAAQHKFNLPGSDPLPFKSEEKKAGSFGFILNKEINLSTPFSSLMDNLNFAKEQFKTYGKLESTISSIRNQFAMQIAKRKRDKN